MWGILFLTLAGQSLLEVGLLHFSGYWVTDIAVVVDDRQSEPRLRSVSEENSVGVGVNNIL